MLTGRIAPKTQPFISPPVERKKRKSFVWALSHFRKPCDSKFSCEKRVCLGSAGRKHLRIAFCSLIHQLPHPSSNRFSPPFVSVWDSISKKKSWYWTYFNYNSQKLFTGYTSSHKMAVKAIRAQITQKSQISCHFTDIKLNFAVVLAEIRHTVNGRSLFESFPFWKKNWTYIFTVRGTHFKKPTTAH